MAQDHLRRREVLAAAAVVAGVSLAGCADEPEDDDDDPDMEEGTGNGQDIENGD